MEKELYEIIQSKSGNDPQHLEKVKDFECGVHPPFTPERDPTLLVRGVRSGQETDYLPAVALLVRLDCQVLERVTVNDDLFFTNVIESKLLR